ncbi:MAG: hypothetical protein ACLSCQ_10390 [Evtepia gabavorous]
MTKPWGSSPTSSSTPTTRWWTTTPLSTSWWAARACAAAMPRPPNTCWACWGWTPPTSPARPRESHAWNLAWLDGTPCWIDTTWGDPVFTGGDDSQGPAYEYFGLTTDDLLRTHTIDDKVPVPDCTSNSNNYFFRNGLYFSAYDPDALTALFQRAWPPGSARSASAMPTRPTRRLRRPV